jgi:hypothetical protein
MGRIVIAAFRPHPGKEAELLGVIADRLPLLRRLGLATQRRPMLVRSREGVIIEVSEWVSQEAIDRAHREPEVLALWERYGRCCEYVKLGALAEAGDDFAVFEAID